MRLRALSGHALRGALGALARGRRRGPPPVLAYHSVDESGGPLSVTPRRLCEHLDALRRGGWRGLTSRGFLERLRGTGDGAPEILITFDDGYRNFGEAAAPILAERGFPATVFVVTDLVGGRAGWYVRDSEPILSFLRGRGYPRRALLHLERALPALAESPLMDWAQLAQIAAAGFDVQPHGSSHRFLPQLGERELAEDLRRSRSAIEGRLGLSAQLIAYPYGAADARVAAAAAAAGFAAGMLAEDEDGSQPFLLGRIALGEFHVAGDLQLFLSAAGDAYRRLAQAGKSLAVFGGRLGGRRGPR